MTNKEFSNKQIDKLLNSHPEILQIWKGFEIIGRPCWQGMRGHRVICNGYEGSIERLGTGQLEGMADVRLDRGAVCVPLTELHSL
jgi:hypothetical protein